MKAPIDPLPKDLERMVRMGAEGALPATVLHEGFFSTEFNAFVWRWGIVYLTGDQEHALERLQAAYTAWKGTDGRTTVHGDLGSLDVPGHSEVDGGEESTLEGARPLDQERARGDSENDSGEGLPVKPENGGGGTTQAPVGGLRELAGTEVADSSRPDGE